MCDSRFNQVLRRVLVRAGHGAAVPWWLVLCCHRLARRLTGASAPLCPAPDGLTLAQQHIEDPFIRDVLMGLRLTAWGLDVDTLNWLVRFMRRHRIGRVLEFGSGLSTLVFAHCCRSQVAQTVEAHARPGCPLVVSVEQDAVYANQTRALLDRAELGEKALVLHSPLVDRQWGDASVRGYEFDPVALSQLPANWAADLVFVDGPATDGWGRIVAAMDGLSYAAAGGWLAMDDAFRDEEMRIMACLRVRGDWTVRGVVPVGKGLALARVKP